MKASSLTLLLIGFMAFSLSRSLAQDTDFQAATIVSVEKLPSTAARNQSASDAPLASNMNEYNLGIQLNGKVYSCRILVHGDNHTWTDGKEIQAKVEGKVMKVKMPHGDIARLKIVSSKSGN